MKVLICGDRNWTDYALIKHCLAQLHQELCVTLVIEGEARGADVLGRRAAIELGIPVARFPAQWDTYGRAAGPIRNRQMLDEHPDLVLAFHDSIESSKGTKDCVKDAERRGIPARIVSHARKE